MDMSGTNESVRAGRLFTESLYWCATTTEMKTIIMVRIFYSKE